MSDYRIDIDPAGGRWPALAELRALLADQKVSAGHLVLGCLRRIAAARDTEADKLDAQRAAQRALENEQKEVADVAE